MKSIDSLIFDKEQATRLIGSFHQEMARGLKREKSSLKMLSSFVKRPKGNEKGMFFAVDLGGTNFRVMAVKLHGDKTFTVTASNSYVIPKKLTGGDGALLFDFIASSIDSFLFENKFSRVQRYGLGFTFSFPVQQTSINSGNLITWTKDFSASGVVGNDVVALLASALKRKKIECVTIDALANDTVGTLMTKSYQRSDCDLGVIIGTGTNACYPEAKERNGNVVNIEWGNFDKFARSSFDDDLDRASTNRKEQIFEKAVSGMYLGEIFRIILCSMPRFSSCIECKPYSISSKDLSDIATDQFDLTKIGLKNISGDDVSDIKLVAGMVSKRSARLAASAIASIVLWLDSELREKHIVAIDGSLFEKYPGYSQEMEMFLKEILGEKSKKVFFELAKDGSGVGAAIIAAVAAQEDGHKKMGEPL